MDYKKSFQSVLKRHVIPLMKEHAFENKGQMFRRYAGEVVQFFVFQGWNGNSTNSHWFTANLHFRRQTVYNISDIGRKDWYEDDVSGHLLTERFGYLTHGRDHWYKMERMAEGELAEALCADLIQFLFPVFNKCTDAEMVLKLKELNKSDWLNFSRSLSHNS